MSKPHPEEFRRTRPQGSRRSRLVARGPNERVVRLGIGSAEALRDIYVVLLTAEWRWFLLGSTAIYLSVNVLFAVLYMLQPGSVVGAHPGSFGDAFFFSVQTIATIGYGGMAPATTYANLLVTTETLIGMTILALATGLMFARFSRPTARVLFSEKVVIGTSDGQRVLSFRMANRRASQIVQAQVTLTYVCDERTAEGDTFRRFYDLSLVRALTPIFAMSFTVAHVIDERSPLRDATPGTLAAVDAELVATVTGLEETMMQNVHARHSWEAREILWHHRFVDILGYLEDGRRAIDYTRFHDTEPAGRP